MELWELYACVDAYNKLQSGKSKEQIAICWQTANFVGAAFAGKLKPLKRYIKDSTKTVAPKVSKDEFERRLKAAQERRETDGTEKA